MLSSIFEMVSNINFIFYMVGYLVGGIPFGLILAKMFTKTDIRLAGSGSIGATNVLRVLKQTNPKLAKKLAIATVALDALKGLSVIFVAYLIGLGVSVQWTIGVVAILGHCFSPYLKFEGGKGVATALGIMIWFLPLETLIAGIAWFLLGKSVKISSISSLGGLTALIVSSYIFHFDMPHIHTHAPIFIIAFIIIYKHIPNIARLFEGKEKQVI